MKARIAARLLGATAALALLIPVATSPASAQGWSPGYGNGADEGYPPAQGYRDRGYQAQEDQDYTAPPEYGAARDERSRDYDESQGYGVRRSAPDRYGRAHGYGPDETYSRTETYRRDETYGANAYGPDETYDRESRSLYRAPEVPPRRQGYAGSSEGPGRYGPDYSGTYPGSGWGAPRTGWVTPQSDAGRYAPAPSGRLVSAVDLNLRVGPSDAAPVQAVLPAGTPVRVTGTGQNGWVQVESPFGAGWVYGRYLGRA